MFHVLKSKARENTEGLHETQGGSRVLQCVVPGDGEVEAGLVDSGRGAVQRQHRGRTQQFGIKEFKKIYKQQHRW